MSTSRNTGSGAIKTFDPENIGISVGILLLCALKLEICLGILKNPDAGKRRKKIAAGTRVNTYRVILYFVPKFPNMLYTMATGVGLNQIYLTNLNWPTTKTPNSARIAYIS